jgi:hypothetical protein
MKAPKLIITINDLQKEPCERYHNLPEGKFDAGEEIVKHGNHYQDVVWLIMYCKKAQTKEWFDYYKSLNPSYVNVSWLIVNCEEAQTEEWLDYYKSLKPYYKDVSWLIRSCSKAQTKEMFEYYKSLKPDAFDIGYLTGCCLKAREYFSNEPEIIKIWTQKQN